jgi:hypothetical protein
LTKLNFNKKSAASSIEQQSNLSGNERKNIKNSDVTLRKTNTIEIKSSQINRRVNSSQQDLDTLKITKTTTRKKSNFSTVNNKSHLSDLNDYMEDKDDDDDNESLFQRSNEKVDDIENFDEFSKKNFKVNGLHSANPKIGHVPSGLTTELNSVAQSPA